MHPDSFQTVSRSEFPHSSLSSVSSIVQTPVMADKLIKGAVQGIAGGIGLVSEGLHARKEKKKAEKEHKDDPPPEAGDHIKEYDDVPPESREPVDGVPAEEHDEKHWELDEAQDELLGRTDSKGELFQKSSSQEHDSKRDLTQLADDFITAHPAPPPGPPPGYSDSEGVPPDYSKEAATARLPLPIILPQRRPKDRSRGFVRAYAPDLQLCGIDQETFLDFLETFNKASLASPWIQAINLASMAGMMLPMGISMAISIAIKMAIDATSELQARSRFDSLL